MKKKIKIIISIVSIVIVLVVALGLFSLYQDGAFKSKLQRLEDFLEPRDAWDFYVEEIRGTRHEEKGREIMLDQLEYGIHGFLNSARAFELINNYPDTLTKIVEFLQEFKADDPLYSRANAALTAYQGMLDLSEALTDPFDIYATPSAYYGETVTLIGEIESNDVRRRMLHIDVGNLRYLEVSYEYAGVISALLNEDSPEKSADEWLHVEGGYIVAIGEVKQYTDSTNAFLATTRISELGDCNWEAISNYIN